MQKTLSSILIIFSLLLHSTVKSQTGISIPAFTAYAVPVEKSNEDDESNMFSVKNGLQNWTDTKQQIQFYFKLRTTGRLSLSLRPAPVGIGFYLLLVCRFPAQHFSARYRKESLDCCVEAFECFAPLDEIMFHMSVCNFLSCSDALSRSSGVMAANALPSCVNTKSRYRCIHV